MDRTNAERQRRYIERLKARAAAAAGVAVNNGPSEKAKPDGAAAQEIAALKKELAQAKARIAKMAARAPTSGIARTSAPRNSEDAPRSVLKADRIQILQAELGRTRELLAKAEAKLATTPKDKARRKAR